MLAPKVASASSKKTIKSQPVEFVAVSYHRCRHVEPLGDADVELVRPRAPEVDLVGQELGPEAGEGAHDGAEAVEDGVHHLELAEDPDDGGQLVSLGF